MDTRHLFFAISASASILYAGESDIQTAQLEQLLRLPVQAHRDDFSTLQYTIVRTEKQQFLLFELGDMQSTHVYINAFLELDQASVGASQLALRLRIIKGVRDQAKFAQPTDDGRIQRQGMVNGESKYLLAVEIPHDLKRERIKVDFVETIEEGTRLRMLEWRLVFQMGISRRDEVAMGCPRC